MSLLVSLFVFSAGYLTKILFCSHCIQQILEGVNHCHQNHIIHRDLKVGPWRQTEILTLLTNKYTRHTRHDTLTYIVYALTHHCITCLPFHQLTSSYHLIFLFFPIFISRILAIGMIILTLSWRSRLNFFFLPLFIYPFVVFTFHPPFLYSVGFYFFLSGAARCLFY